MHPQSRHKLIHPNCRHVLQQVSVPTLSRFHARMPEKVADLEDIARLLVNETASVSSQLVAGFSSIPYPSTYPSGMSPIDGVFAVRRCSPRHDVIFRREMAKRISSLRTSGAIGTQPSLPLG